MSVTLRPALPVDHAMLVAAVDDWWGGRAMSVMLPPLFLEHFASTSLVAEEADGSLAGFLVGFMSVDDGFDAYAHFVGVRPDLRGDGLGRRLHDVFAGQMTRRGARRVRCITSVDNTASVAFHTSIGFVVDGEDGGRVLMSRSIVDPVDEPPAPRATWPLDDAAVLSGEWVELRRTVESDAEALVTALRDDRVWRHTVSAAQGDDNELRTALPVLVERGILPWTVRLRRALGDRDPGTVVGWTSYLDVSPDDARLEIGYTAYDPAVWGTQVNPECKLLLLGHAFDALHMGRVQFKTDVRNERSRRAIARLGARQEGVLRSYQRRGDGTIRDSALFSITAEEWPTVRDRLWARIHATL